MAAPAVTGIPSSGVRVNGSRLIPKFVYRISLKCSAQTSEDKNVVNHEELVGKEENEDTDGINVA
jgi:hypothetical protein